MNLTVVILERSDPFGTLKPSGLSILEICFQRFMSLEQFIFQQINNLKRKVVNSIDGITTFYFSRSIQTDATHVKVIPPVCKHTLIYIYLEVDFFLYEKVIDEY